MVGRETRSTYTNGRPAMMSSCFVVVVAYSGPATGCASGAAAGHIGTCLCPGSGGQAVFCAFTQATERTKQRAKSPGLIRISRTQAYNSESPAEASIVAERRRYRKLGSGRCDSRIKVIKRS